MSDHPKNVDAFPVVLSRDELRAVVRALARSRRGLPTYLQSGRAEASTLAEVQQRCERALQAALQATHPTDP